MNFSISVVSFDENSDYRDDKFQGAKQCVKLIVSPSAELSQTCQSRRIPVLVKSKYTAIDGTDWENGDPSNREFSKSIDNSKHGSKIELWFTANRANAIPKQNDEIELTLSSYELNLPAERYNLVFAEAGWCMKENIIHQ